MKNIVFWYVTLWISVERYRRFGRRLLYLPLGHKYKSAQTDPDYGESTFLENFGDVPKKAMLCQIPE